MWINLRKMSVKPVLVIYDSPIFLSEALKLAECIRVAAATREWTAVICVTQQTFSGHESSTQLLSAHHLHVLHWTACRNRWTHPPAGYPGMGGGVAPGVSLPVRWVREPDRRRRWRTRIAIIPDIRPDAPCFRLFQARCQYLYRCVVSVKLAGIHHMTVQGIIQRRH